MIKKLRLLFLLLTVTVGSLLFGAIPVQAASSVPPTSSDFVISATAGAQSPVLVSYDISPHTASVGSTITLSYTINNPGTAPVNVGLGATIRDSALNYINDPYHGELVVNVPPATTATYNRNFHLPGNISKGSYCVYWGIWDSSFSQLYQMVWREDCLTVGCKPVAVGETYLLQQNSTLYIEPRRLLANDTDQSGHTLTVSSVSNPSHGTLTHLSNGSFDYEPALDYLGQDSFTYTANDGQTDSNAATVTISVLVPDEPKANNDTFTAVGGTPLAVNAPGLLANDHLENDAIYTELEMRGGPSHGRIPAYLNNDGSFIYYPDDGYVGTDTFSYMLYQESETGPSWSIASVTITITPSNTATFGLNGGASSWYQGAGVYNAQRFQNTAATGTLIKLEILISQKLKGGYVRMAVYADDHGSPGSLLVDAGNVPVYYGWVTSGALNLPVTQGTYYWLVFTMSDSNLVAVGDGSGPHMWQDILFAPFLNPYPPTPAWGWGTNQKQFVMRATVRK
jgi:hypothetical protein